MLHYVNSLDALKCELVRLVDFLLGPGNLALRVLLDVVFYSFVNLIMNLVLLFILRIDFELFFGILDYRKAFLQKFFNLLLPVFLYLCNKVVDQIMLDVLSESIG